MKVFLKNINFGKNTHFGERRYFYLFLRLPIGWFSGEIWARISIGCLFITFVQSPIKRLQSRNNNLRKNRFICTRENFDWTPVCHRISIVCPSFCPKLYFLRMIFVFPNLLFFISLYSWERFWFKKRGNAISNELDLWPWLLIDKPGPRKILDIFDL